jgi:hypothetical protein
LRTLVAARYRNRDAAPERSTHVDARVERIARRLVAVSDQSSRARARLMREALVEAKMGLAQSRKARDGTEARLARERAELETVRRRGQLAADIHDLETVRVAAEFERKHSDRIVVLERKRAALEEEVLLMEREEAEMTAQLRSLTGGADPVAPVADDTDDAAADISELDGMRRAADRSAREADAERRLADLKRRMGK